ncbi:MAG: hypothetical protein U5O39_16565 [Gammaproteobacteria bacterium]|nr:hypothetical protein [Gammaproteobacteria bacterium]
MGFRFQDALDLDTAETARTFGIAMMASAGCSLFAQGVIVQRFNLAPFTLLKMAMPLLIIAFVLMATFDTQMILTIAMMIQGSGMGWPGRGSWRVLRSRCRRRNRGRWPVSRDPAVRSGSPSGR